MKKQLIKKYTKRIEELIKTGENLREHVETDIQTYNKESYIIPSTLRVKFENDVRLILKIAVGENNSFLKDFEFRMRKAGSLNYCLDETIGILLSLLENIKNGYFNNIEIRITNEIFDNLLEESKHFIYEKDHKDIGALLLRIVLEDNLKRISKKEGIELKTQNGKDRKASELNIDLKQKEFYNQTQSRQIQAWLDLGNDAHHGKFDKYSIKEVKSFYDGLNNFIAIYFN